MFSIAKDYSRAQCVLTFKDTSETRLLDFSMPSDLQVRMMENKEHRKAWAAMSGSAGLLIYAPPGSGKSCFINESTPESSGYKTDKFDVDYQNIFDFIVDTDWTYIQPDNVAVTNVHGLIHTAKYSVAIVPDYDAFVSRGLAVGLQLNQQNYDSMVADCEKADVTYFTNAYVSDILGLSGPQRHLQ